MPNHVHSGFLRYWSRSRRFQEQLASLAGSTDMAPYLSLLDQKRLRISLPPPSEQRAIAQVLGTLDDKIELNRRMNETLEAMARALFRSWFVDFDPVRAKVEGRQPAGMDAETAALFPDAFDESELGAIPSGWSVGTLRDLVTLARGTLNPGDHRDELFDHYSLPALDEGRRPKREAGQQIKSAKFPVPADSVLLSKLNPHIPRIWLPSVSAHRRSICSTEFMVLVPRIRSHREFVYTLVSGDQFLGGLRSLVGGTTGSHQRVQPEQVLNMTTLVSRTAVVDRFAAVVSSFLERAGSHLEQSIILRTIRDALLPKLLSGEIRVGDLEAKIGAIV